VKIKKNRIVLSIYIIFFLGVLLRIFNPFEEDQKIFFAAARYSTLSDLSFPLNILQTFELKPIFSRVIYYLFFILSNNAFYEISDPFVFIIFQQGILVILILASLLIYNLSLKNSYLLDRNQLNGLFLLTGVSLIFVGSEVFFQVDHLALILAIFSLGLLINNSKNLNFTGAIITGLLAGIKGVTILYVPMVYISLFILSHKKKNLYKYLLLSTIVACVSLLISWDELSNASKMQNLNLHSLSQNFVNKIFISKYVFADLPLLFSFFLGLILIFLEKNKFIFDSNKEFFLFLILVFLSFLYPLTQVGFTYHYIALYFPIYIFIFFLIINQKINKNSKFFPAVIFFVSVFFVSFSGGGLTLISKVYEPFEKYSLIKINLENFYSEIDTFNLIKKNIPKGEKILFLTDGVANFYLKDYESACEEFYPLSINRLMNKEHKNESDLFSRTLKCIQGYQGRFVLIQSSWLPEENYFEVYPNNNYKKVKMFSTKQRDYLLYEKQSNLIKSGKRWN